MKQLKQAGFGLIEVLLLLVIAGIIGFTGWRIYSANSDSDESTTIEEVTWETYSDDKIAIYHPSNWTVERNDNKSLPGTFRVDVTAPADEDWPIKKSLDDGVSNDADLKLEIFGWAPGDDRYTCDTDCKVYDVVDLNNSSGSKAKLIFSEGTSVVRGPVDDGPEFLEVVDSNPKVGATSYVAGAVFRVADDRVMTIQVELGSGLKASEIDSLKDTEGFRILVKILNFLHIKK